MQVHIYTAYYDLQRCFDETKSGAFQVHTAGSWFPRAIFSRFVALCAYIRCILVALRLSWDSRMHGAQYDVIIADQVSAVIPFLKLFTQAKILFYCHFPDLLLASHRSRLQAAYRGPLDWVEQTTTGMADAVLVNSAFTQNIFRQTFPRLAAKGVMPAILHPTVRVPSETELQQAQNIWREALPKHIVDAFDAGPTFVSINRFERKKGIGLSIAALGTLLDRLNGSSSAPRFTAVGYDASEGEERTPSLVLAGGYDARLKENVEHLEELHGMATELGVRDRVFFLPSFTDAQRAALFAGCTAVLYTPPDEHFGIVPLEAMAAGKPVIACDSGGPLESVIDGETGLLRPPEAEAWAFAMQGLLDAGRAQALGRQARRHVLEQFSREIFGARLNEIVLNLAGRKAKVR
jgi:alpha-1,3/alpha-1,6-mannosyltransferase